ncbi:MAG: MATE family efflux transporter [Rikenellaceae bacterium]
MKLLERKYYKKNLQLALPIIIANLGQATVGIIDNIMVGQLGALELAAASLATIILHNVLVFGIGIATSLTPLTGELFATGSYKKAASLFQNSLLLNIVIGLILSVGMYYATPLFYLMGQPEGVVVMAESYFKIISLSIFPFLAFLAFKQFMEGIGNTKVSMSITIISNILNIVLNYLLIYGKFGFPQMGVNGAAVATLISRIFMPIAFYIYFRSHNSLKRYFNFFAKRNMRLQSQKMLLAVGLPISGQITVEVFALSVTAIYMGWISTESLAANQIALSICSAMFQVVLGISGAVTILTSHAFGAKNRTDIKNYTYAGMQMSSLFMLCGAAMFIFLGRYIAMAYTDDLAVIDIATKVFYVIALFEFSDGMQVTILGALRGLKDVQKPMIFALISYLFINVPVAYFFGFTLGFGEMGIWFGFFIGLTTAGIQFFIRFRKIVNSSGLFE